MKEIGITECKNFQHDEVYNNRYFECVSYDDCLDEAVRNNMSNFTCKNCHAFQSWKEALKHEEDYEVLLPGQRVVIKRFKPGHIDLKTKNIGTLWND